jgi:hypothetical protein
MTLTCTLESDSRPRILRLDNPIYYKKLDRCIDKIANFVRGILTTRNTRFARDTLAIPGENREVNLKNPQIPSGSSSPLLLASKIAVGTPANAQAYS